MNIKELLHGIGFITGRVKDSADKICGRVSNGIGLMSDLKNSINKQAGSMVIVLQHLEYIQKEAALFNEHENVLSVILIQEAFLDEDIEFIDICLEDIFGLKPSHDLRQALWHVTVKSERWTHIEPEGLIKYLYVCIRNEAARIKRDREVFDSLWVRSEQIVYNDPDVFLFENKTFSNPEEAVLRAEERRIRYLIILEIMNEGSNFEKKILKMLIAGYTPSECLKEIGGRWSHYQAIQRKLRRRLKKIRYKECLVI